MCDTRNTFDADPDSLETVIRAAGSFVQPSDDLRPRTLEAAREYRNDQRARQKLAGSALICLAVVGLVSTHATDTNNWRPRISAPTRAEIQKEAMALESLPHIGTEFGLAEAFTRLRRAQASWFGQSTLIKQ